MWHIFSFFTALNVNLENTLKVCHINVQGLQNKLDEIEILLTRYDLDILCVSEHWFLHSDIKNICLPGYKLISHCSRTEHIHGGSLILSKNNLLVTDIVSINKQSIHCNIEVSGASLVLNETNIAIITIYRPPSGDFNVFMDKLIEILKLADKKFNNIILCGDLNIDYGKITLNRNILCDVLDSFQLIRTTNQPTRIFTNVNGDTTSSALDYMTTNLPLNLYKCEIINPQIADHFAHILSFSLPSISSIINKHVNENNFVTRNLSQLNINQLIHYLKKINWAMFYEFVGKNDINSACYEFIENIKWCLEASCPLVTFKVNSTARNNSWYGEELREMSNYLKMLHWNALHSNQLEVKDLYRQHKKEYKKQIIIAKQKYFNNRIDKANNKTKATWLIVNEKLGRIKSRQEVITLRNNDQVITDAKLIAETFALFFTTNCNKALLDHFGQNLSLPCTTSYHINITMPFNPISENDVYKLVAKLKNKNTAGNDGINSKILKIMFPFISLPLTSMINSSVQYGIFPEMMKTALVIPLHKKGDVQIIDNYRQISLLTEISKILERVVYNLIISFIENHNLLTESQHGFRSNKSVETASYHLLNYVYSELDQGKYVISLLFDLTKAFDSINQDFLLKKVYNLGVRGPVLNWISSYLTNRKLIVKVEQQSSSQADVSLGVPQGSVLGPLLFMLFINDLPNHISFGKVTMFADDVSITVSAETPEELQALTEKVCEEYSIYCQRNKVILNEHKTVCLNFHLRKALPDNFSIFGIPLSINTKLLGTMIDSDLSFQSHINHVCNQLNKAYFAIYQIKPYLNLQGILNVYYALAYSHISYNIATWGSATESIRVFIAQKRLIRLIFNLNWLETCKYTFINKKILTVPCIFIFKCLTFTKRNLNTFVKVGEGHEHHTRYGYYLQLPKHRTATYERSPHYKFVTLYNALPPELKSIGNYDQFKRAVKTFLLEGAYYSIDEFIHRQ